MIDRSGPAPERARELGGSLSRRLRSFFTPLVALVIGCTSTTPSPPVQFAELFEATPLVWRARSEEGAVVYLTGSVHTAREEIHDFGSVIDAAWKDTEELVVEVDVTLLSPQDMATLAARYGGVRAPQTLRDMISDDTWQRLEAYLASRGIPASTVLHWKPWFAYFVVVQHELDRAGYTTGRGVDRLFIDAAIREGKPVAALETAASQLQVFDNLPDDLEEVLLKDSLSRVDHFDDEAEELIDAWKDGGEEELRELVFAPLEQTPSLGVFYDLVFFQRNRQMVGSIDQLSADGRTRLVVIGAGHMVGEQSIPSLLAERGWRVERIGGTP